MGDLTRTGIMEDGHPGRKRTGIIPNPFIIAAAAAAGIDGNASGGCPSWSYYAGSDPMARLRPPQHPAGGQHDISATSASGIDGKRSSSGASGSSGFKNEQTNPCTAPS